MPAGKRFCRYEHAYFSVAEFVAVGPLLVHEVPPRHEAITGLVLQSDGTVSLPKVPPVVMLRP